MIKAICDFCEDEIEFWQQCASRDEEFEKLFVHGEKGLCSKQTTFTLQLVAYPDAQKQDVCRDCMKRIVAGLAPLQEEE